MVLDTNAVLDRLVFANPSSLAWAEAVEAGRLTWLTCPIAAAELQHELTRRDWSRWSPDIEQALTFVSRHARLCSDPPPLPAQRLRCTDPADQVFLDLALMEGARWLVTHDRALLKLHRKTAPRGLNVLRPQDFEALRP